MLLLFLIIVKTFCSGLCLVDTRCFHIVGVGITKVVLSPVTKCINKSLKLESDSKDLRSPAVFSGLLSPAVELVVYRLCSNLRDRLQ